MKFNFTNGKTAKYMVSVYKWNQQDCYYYHFFKDAMKKFESLKSLPFEKDTVVSIYDVKNDIRKAFVRF